MLALSWSAAARACNLPERHLSALLALKQRSYPSDASSYVRGRSSRTIARANYCSTH
jgi:hypothetical protein